MKKSAKENDFYIQALLLSEIIKRILKAEGGIDLSGKPVLEAVNIVSFMERMRIWHLEKFNDEVYLSVVHFYKDDNDKKQNKVLGSMIVYLPENYLFVLFKKMKYPEFDQYDETALKNACGTFCNVIAEKFKSSLTQLDYIELCVSPAENYKGAIVNGVAYNIKERQKYEMSFEIKGEKRMMVDLTMGGIPKIA